MSAKKKGETFEAKGGQLIEKVKELIAEGNIRQIAIKDKKGKTLIVFLLTVGVWGSIGSSFGSGWGNCCTCYKVQQLLLKEKVSAGILLLQDYSVT